MAAVAWATDLYIAFHGVPSLRYLQWRCELKNWGYALEGPRLQGNVRFPGTNRENFSRKEEIEPVENTSSR